jgi:phytol kinase
MSRDTFALLISYAYVFSAIGGAEAIRKRFGLGVEFTRKIVHVGVGIWVVPTLLLFEDWRIAAIPPASFVLVNLLSYRFRIFRAIEGAERTNIGTVLFPASFVVLLAAFWGRPEIVSGGILVLALGDAAAALVGRRFGRRRYRVGSAVRSVEGSSAMALASLVALIIAMAVFRPHVPLAALVGVALWATLIEALSLFGTDNVLVPVGTALALYVVL